MTFRDPMRSNPSRRQAPAAVPAPADLPPSLTRPFRKETPQEAVERAARAQPAATGAGDLAFVAAMLAKRGVAKEN
ncbi:hypothetical protein [Roseomonas populi]|uniref:Uncharacterized protein n=1 Tax=Roseomonas populi TaxID=3121582 RepID=A0ABT1WXA2_9PROT|nr:hypothetical protein [Roseomonas pecuniae]MCR0980465.1 hypothetical protein [Roseomonas pecuniae]